MFQHVILPEAAFENHPELISDLESGASPLPLMHFRAKAEIRLASATGNPLSRATGSASAAEQELFDAIAIHAHKRDGFTVYVVTMPKPEFCLEAYFAAIVHKDNEPHKQGQQSQSTRYFVLEKSVTPLPVLCEWQRDGSHAYSGRGPAPEMAAFVEAVFARVARAA